VDLGDADVAGGAAPRFNTIGFDLDGYCTTQAQLDKNTGQECQLPPWAMPKDAPHWGVPDGPNGQDNAIGSNIQFIRDRLGNFNSENYTASLKNPGASNAIIKVTGYNGESNDDQVTVTVLTGGDFKKYNAGSPPKWDGTDTWPVNDDSFNTAKQPIFVDNQAYVDNGKMVASLKTAGLRLLVSLTQDANPAYLKMLLHRAYAVCDVKPSTLGRWGWVLQNCTLAGVWHADDLVHQLAQFPDIINGGQLCRPAVGSTGGIYPVFKQAICNRVDLFTDSNNPVGFCDALSIGVGFNTVPGIIGDIYATRQIDDLAICPPGRRPSEDNCEPPESPDAGGGSGGTSGSGGSGARDAGTRDASSTDASKDH
jgi:hypothetical protein